MQDLPSPSPGKAGPSNQPLATPPSFLPPPSQGNIEDEEAKVEKGTLVRIKIVGTRVDATEIVGGVVLMWLGEVSSACMPISSSSHAVP